MLDLVPQICVLAPVHAELWHIQFLVAHKVKSLNSNLVEKFCNIPENIA